MKTPSKHLLMLSLSSLLAVAPLASATDAKPTLGSIERSHAKQTSALLERAVAFLESNGPERSLVAFNDRKGSFAQGQYYIFVLDQDGIMHASGAAASGLVGLDVAQLRDAAGKPFIREILDAASVAETGQVDYHWLNPADNNLETKVSQFRKVGDYILAVGYYIPRASVEQAQALLDKAVTLMKDAGGEAAFKAFNDPQGGFVNNDEYVFVIGLEDGKYRASGASPNLLGVDVRGINDAAGKPLFKEMIALAKDIGIGSVDYVWRNPATNAVEHKRSLIQRVDDVLLGVGYYPRP